MARREPIPATRSPSTPSMKHLLIAFSLVISTAGSALAYCSPPFSSSDTISQHFYDRCIQREAEEQKRQIEDQQRQIDKLRRDQLYRRLYSY